MDNNTQGGAWNFDPTALAGDVGVSALQPIMDRAAEREKSYAKTAAGDNFFVAGTYTRTAPELMNFNISDYSLVGMNATKAKEVAAKINASVDRNLVPLVQQITTDASQAFKGEAAQAAFTDYVNAVKTYISNLITDLKAFSDKIYEVGDLYAASDKSLASKITASAGFAGTAYNPTRATVTAATGYGNSFINAEGKTVVPLSHDLNGDGKVNSTDAQMALNDGNKELADKILAESGDLNVGNAVLEGSNPHDLNGDGLVDSVDASIAKEQGNETLAAEILSENADAAAADANPNDLNGDGLVDPVDASIAEADGNPETAQEILSENADAAAADATGNQAGDVPEGGYPSEGGEIPETPAEEVPTDSTGDAPEAAPETTDDGGAGESSDLDEVWGSNQ